MRILAAIVLVLFVAQQHSKSIYLGYFLINRAAITQAKCINRNKPEMQCDGKCHLKKTLKEATPEPEVSQESSKDEMPRFQVKDILLYFSSFTADFAKTVFSVMYPGNETISLRTVVSRIPTPPPEY